MAVRQYLSWIFCCVLVFGCVYGLTTETSETSAIVSTAAATTPSALLTTTAPSPITNEVTNTTLTTDTTASQSTSPNLNASVETSLRPVSNSSSNTSQSHGISQANATIANANTTMSSSTTTVTATTFINVTVMTTNITGKTSGSRTFPGSSPVSEPTQPSKTNVAQTTSSSTGTISNNPSAPTQTTEPGRSPVSALMSLVHVYPTIAYNADNTCPFGYKADVSLKACVHLCEYKKCQNGGECYAEVDVKNGTIAKCRCQETSRYVYKGDNCETSAISRSRERAITLGILLPFSIIFLFIIVAMCMKLKRGGNEIRAAHKSYDINNL